MEKINLMTLIVFLAIMSSIIGCKKPVEGIESSANNNDTIAQKTAPLFKYQLPQQVDSLFRQTYRLDFRTQKVLNKLTGNKQKHKFYITSKNIDEIVNNIPVLTSPSTDSIRFHLVLADKTKNINLEKYDGSVVMICNYMDKDNNLITDQSGRKYFFIFGDKITKINENDFKSMKNEFKDKILPTLNKLVSNKLNTKMISASTEDFKNFMENKKKVKISFAEYFGFNKKLFPKEKSELLNIVEKNSIGQMMIISDSYDKESDSTINASKSGYNFNTLCPTSCPAVIPGD